MNDSEARDKISIIGKTLAEEMYWKSDGKSHDNIHALTWDNVQQKMSTFIIWAIPIAIQETTNE